MNRPTAEFQLSFLEYIQRLLDGGGFTATYKFALLMAIADLSVEKGGDPVSSLPLHARDVAEKFIRYYSRQALPYSGPDGTAAGIIHQNTDKQARVVNLVREAIPAYDATGIQAIAKKLQRDKLLVGKVASTVATMSLWKLQTVAGEVDDFLYENKGKGREFELRPGVSYCFRKFHGFIYRLVQSSWVKFIRERQQNHNLLGKTSDLADFMFGVDRSSLKPYRALLDDLQKGRCFYCSTGTGVGHIDHFIPWSWYSLDLGHNFVLSCEACNGKKHDWLAAPEHLGRWLDRNENHDVAMRGFFESNSLPYDSDGSLFIARWAYGRVAENGGPTWVRKKEFEKISVVEGWRFPG